MPMVVEVARGDDGQPGLRDPREQRVAVEAANGVVGDREHVDAGPAVEVAQVARRQLAVTPGRVRVKLAEEWFELGVR